MNIEHELELSLLWPLHLGSKVWSRLTKTDSFNFSDDLLQLFPLVFVAKVSEHFNNNATTRHSDQ